MKHWAIIAVVALLHGCAVTLHGNQVSSGGSTVTTTGSSVQAGKQIGNALVGASFGAPPVPHAGGQVTFSQGASAALMLIVVIAGTAEMISDWFRPPDAPRNGRGPTGNISQTCSCYASNSELTPDPAAK
jgi:hypothetical protein